jgi:hypothetical protein
MMQPKVEGYVAPPVGSSWTQSNRNTGSYGPSGTSQITRAERTWEGKPVIAFIGARGVFLMDPEGGDVAFVGQDDKPLLRWEHPSELGLAAAGWKDLHSRLPADRWS